MKEKVRKFFCFPAYMYTNAECKQADREDVE